MSLTFHKHALPPSHLPSLRLVSVCSLISFILLVTVAVILWLLQDEITNFDVEDIEVLEAFCAEVCACVSECVACVMVRVCLRLVDSADLGLIRGCLLFVLCCCVCVCCGCGWVVLARLRR